MYSEETHDTACRSVSQYPNQQGQTNNTANDKGISYTLTPQNRYNAW